MNAAVLLAAAFVEIEGKCGVEENGAAVCRKAQVVGGTLFGKKRLPGGNQTEKVLGKLDFFGRFSGIDRGKYGFRDVDGGRDSCAGRKGEGAGNVRRIGCFEVEAQQAQRTVRRMKLRIGLGDGERFGGVGREENGCEFFGIFGGQSDLIDGFVLIFRFDKLGGFVQGKGQIEQRTLVCEGGGGEGKGCAVLEVERMVCAVERETVG